VRFPAGGPTDIFARLMGQWLSQRLGQPFVVENRPGAGSPIGIALVVGAPADGYTLLLVSTSAVVSASYYKNLSFEIIRDAIGRRRKVGELRCKMQSCRGSGLWLCLESFRRFCVA
jgi:hypothetical protein